MSSQKFVIQQKSFWRHVLLLIIVLGICIFLTSMWLRSYTRHGQQIELPDYTGELLEDAEKDAKSRSFRLEVMDSLHIVGRRAHEIIRQNPAPHSTVKETRTIYVTVTKSTAELIPLSRFPDLYGKKYDRKKEELEKAFQIQCDIIGKQYDPGAPDYILAVVYQGDTIIDKEHRGGDVMIEKGARLGFIVSQSTGGLMPVPNLICLTYAEALFLLENSRLEITEVIQEDQIIDIRGAFVSGQVPDPSEGMIEQGSGMRISLTREKPLSCQ